MPLLAPSATSAPNPGNPADDAVVAQWRMYFLQQVKAVGDESADERVRLAASVAGLRALAQIQAIHQRERRIQQYDRRLQQHERGLELAAQHLAIQKDRAERAAYHEDYDQAAIEAADAADKATTDTNPPLRADEIAAIKEKLGIHSQTLTNPRMANYFRGLLKTQSYWNAYWIGYNHAKAIIKNGGSINVADITEDPTPAAPASPGAGSNTKPAPAPSAKPVPTPEPAAPSRPAPARSEPFPAAQPSAAKFSLGNLVQPQTYLKALPAPPLKPTANEPVIAAQSAAQPATASKARDPPRLLSR